MTLRVAVTGAGGMVGRELVREAAERDVALTAWDREACDVTDGDAVRRAVDQAKPDVVIHAGAWTDVDGCESDPARAFLVNGRGTANVARACRDAGARIVMVSTDYVFSGDKASPYEEDDLPGPISVYGWSKLMGEEAVRALGDGGTVVRTAWIYADHGANFLLTMLRLAKERDEIAVVDDQHGSPTFAADLAGTLLDLAGERVSGTLHATNHGATTWFGYAQRIFELTGSAVNVSATTSDRFPRPARRPGNSVMVGTPELPPWEDALERCLRRLRESW